MTTAQALEILREQAMGLASTREPLGARYNEEMGKLLDKYGFRGLGGRDNKDIRSRLHACMENRAAIESFRTLLPLKERLRLNHPSAMIRRWKASLESKDHSTGKSKGAAQALKAEIQRLREENARLVRNGGSLIEPTDKAGDIADFLCRSLPEPKLKQVLDRCWETLMAENALTADDLKTVKATAKGRALCLVRRDQS